MKRSSLVRDLVERTLLPEPAVESVVAAIADLVLESNANPDALLQALLGSEEPFAAHAAGPRDPAAVADLVERAKAHPLGLDYLRRGHLASVAATFETHAFTVLAARDLLR